MLQEAVSKALSSSAEDASMLEVVRVILAETNDAVIQSQAAGLILSDSKPMSAFKYQLLNILLQSPELAERACFELGQAYTR